MRISLKVKFVTREKGIEKIGDSDYLIRVKERPVKGKANKEMIDLLSKFFKVSKNKIKIVSGTTSSKKIVQIDE